MTQVEVAESLHVSRKTISGWENGRGVPDRAILVQLSQLYQVPIAVLIDDDQELDLSEAALQKAARRRRLTQLSYWLMVPLLGLAYAEFFRLNEFHLPIVMVLAVVNSCVYLSLFSDWGRFSSVRRWLIAITTTLIIFIFNLLTIGLDKRFLKFFTAESPSYLAGVIFGHLADVVFLTVMLMSLIFLKLRSAEPKKKDH